MHISHLVIKNFRALEDIDFDLSPRLNVIVGPNGVGKSTILQAIRLAKAVLAPRTGTETLQVLISLGAVSPHMPQRLFFGNLARDTGKNVEVRCTYTLTDDERSLLESSMGEIVHAIIASRLGQQFQNQASLIQHLQSPMGQQAYIATSEEVRLIMGRLRLERTLMIGVSISPTQGINAIDPIVGILVAFLDQRLPPSMSLFSYFPADRALPSGEVNLQLGGPDSQQQLESHNSQPHLKYLRLKNLIINELVMEKSDGGRVKGEFRAIFSSLLRDRTISTIGINDVGTLSVMTQETSSGRMMELDSLSSGEKNIALTFLIVAVSIAKGGIVLFDEPELHLNAAVSRDVLPFILQRYSKPNDIQFILCTHSPEILAGAFADDECVLMHLKSPSDISRVGKRALGEYSDALQRLGTSVSETLMYDGTIFVEGESDKNFLEIGFPETVRRYTIKARGGRSAIEKTIKELQALENSGQKVVPIYLIFDRDEQLTNMQQTPAVRFLQWRKRCLENYLIDEDVIASILGDENYTSAPIGSVGEVHIRLRNLAFSQLNSVAARDVFLSRNYVSPTIRKGDLEGATISEITSVLHARVRDAIESISTCDQTEWVPLFEAEAEDKRTELTLSWESKWKDLCDGKLLISQLHRASSMKISEDAFRTAIVRKMRDTTSENWELVKSRLEELLNAAK